MVNAKSNELVPFLKLTPEELKNITFYKGAGCSACNGTGYKGRAGLYEVLPMTTGIQEMVMDKKPPYLIKQAAIEDGMVSLHMAGIEKLREGVTTADEVLGATS
jgi:type II secretory ATPase GspE/PulE/Tfp pilus assembly ATPase PilB-like protein